MLWLDRKWDKNNLTPRHNIFAKYAIQGRGIVHKFEFVCLQLNQADRTDHKEK